MNVGKTELLRNLIVGLFITVGALAVADPVSAQAPSGELQVDPATGDVYRQVTREVVRPVVDERIERQEKLVYRPETVKETRPEYSTTYTPVTETKWSPYLQGRWNLFRQPSVAYRKVRETRWEARSEVVNRTTMKTRWVPEKRTVEIPHRTVRYERTRHTDVELVARAMAPPRVQTNVDPAIVARLRPMPSAGPVTSVATNSTRPMGSRSSMQSGMQPQVLNRNSSLGAPLQPAAAGVGIATNPSLPVYR